MTHTLLTAALLLLLLAVAVKALALLGMFEIQLLPIKYDKLLHHLADFIGTTFLTLAYITILAFLFHKSSLRLFTWIGNAGRLGLTNYFGQTLMCMLIFYGYAGGLAGKMPLCNQSFLSLVFTFSRSFVPTSGSDFLKLNLWNGFGGD